MSASAEIRQDVYKPLLTPVKVVKGSEIAYQPESDRTEELWEYFKRLNLA